MRSGTIVEPKSGTKLKLLLLVGVLTALTACGKKKKSPPRPCGVGVNQSVCAAEVRGHTAWSTWLKSYSVDEKTKQPVPGSERKITVIYEFMEASPAAQWRRTLIVEAADGNTGMYQQGRVKSLTGNQIEFITEQSTCDDYNGPRFANADFTLYYNRYGATIKMDNQPIVEKRARSLGDAIANAMTEVIGAGLRLVLEQAFSFGSARKFLESGHGSFSLDPNPSLQQLATKNVELGCFSTFGTGYTKSAIKPNW